MSVNSNCIKSITYATDKNEMTTKLAHVLIQKITTFYSVYPESF